MTYSLDMYRLAHEHVPALSCLLPTYDFLISNGALGCDTNRRLEALNESSRLDRLGKEDNTEGKIRTKIFMGDGTPTLTNIFVGTRDCDRLLYPDGKPRSSFLTQTSNSGDGTVLTSSATLGNIVSYAPTKKGSQKGSQKGSHAQLIDTYSDELVQFVKEEAGATPLALRSEPSIETQATSGAKMLTVSVLGRAQPYILDPSGRKSGIDPATGLRVEEIPSTTLSMNGKGLNLTIEEPVDGEYTIHLTEGYTEDYKVLFYYMDAEKSGQKSAWLYSHGGADSFSFSLNSSAGEPLKINRIPAPPEGLQADPVETDGLLETRLCWNSDSSGEVTGYNLYSREEDEASLSPLATTGAHCFDTGHLWTGDASAKTRIYAVSALKADGTESFLSNMAENNDRDHDGLTDAEETSFGTNMSRADTDDDGLSDSEEYVHGTDPLMKDTDGDGYSDYEEVQVGSDPLNATSLPTPLVAEFCADTTMGNDPLTVHFTDNSSGVIASYEWHFGDGGSSTEKDPVHVYSASGSYTVSLTVTGQGGTNTKTKTNYITVTNPADLSVSMTDTPDPVSVGVDLVYTLQIANAGPEVASGVVLTDTLPGGAAFVSAQSSQGDCNEAAGKVTCNVGELAAGACAEVQIKVRPGVAEAITNTATVTGDEIDPNPANNAATATTTVSSLPTVTLVATDPQASEKVRNRGQFTVYRTGDTSKPLKVNYTLSGTAANGVDYARLSGRIVIPARAASAVVSVRPINDRRFEGDEWVVMSLQANASYLVGTPNRATVTIADNDGR